MLKEFLVPSNNMPTDKRSSYGDKSEFVARSASWPHSTQFKSNGVATGGLLGGPTGRGILVTNQNLPPFPTSER